MLKYYRRAVTLEMRLTFPQIVFVCWISPQHSIICILGSGVSAAGEGVQTSCCRGRADGPRFQKAAPISIFKIRLCLWWWTHRELLPDSASLIAVISDVFSSCRQLFTLTLSVQQQTKLAAKESWKQSECWTSVRQVQWLQMNAGVVPSLLFVPLMVSRHADSLGLLSVMDVNVFLHPN